MRKGAKSEEFKRVIVSVVIVLVVLLAILIYSFFGNKLMFSPNEVLVTECGDLAQENTEYILQNNIVLDGNCFNILSDNVVLDGNGFSIDGTDNSGIGITATDRKNVIIKNFANISNFYEGIYFFDTNNSLIDNVIIIHSSWAGIAFEGSNNYNVISNSVLNYNSGMAAVYLEGGGSNNFTNINLDGNIDEGITSVGSLNNRYVNINVINGATIGIDVLSSNNEYFENITANSNQIGIYVGASTNFGRFNNLVANSNTLRGIMIDGGIGNVFNGFSIENCTDTSDSCLKASGGSNNTFINGIINSSRAVNVLLSNTAQNITLLNVSYAGANQTEIITASRGILTRKWYADVNLNVDSADISWQSNLGDFGLIISSGNKARLELIGYINNGTRGENNSYVLYKPVYTISASKTGYSGDSRDGITVSGNSVLSLSLAQSSGGVSSSGESSGGGGSSGSSGGGGGAGGTSNLAKSYSLSDSQFSYGYGKQLSVGDSITFKVNNEEHRVILNRIGQNSVDVEIRSSPIMLTISAGEERKLDLGGDGYYDLYLKLNGIVYGKADLTIKKIYEKIESEIESGNIISGTNATSNNSGETNEIDYYGGNLWLGAVITVVALILLTGVIIIAIRIRRKRIISNFKKKNQLIGKTSIKP